MQPGTRVEIASGILKGEKATVEINPESGSHIMRYRGDTEVWIRYDRDGEHLGPTKGYAILNPQWYEITGLRVIR